MFNMDLKLIWISIFCVIIQWVPLTSGLEASPRPLQEKPIPPKPIQIVRVLESDKNITIPSNRNVTITCLADLRERLPSSPFHQSDNFTTNARLVLSLLKTPRTKVENPIGQFSSFIHCNDPYRTNCRASFNFDISCIESQLPSDYFLGKQNYQLEIACQADDSVFCSTAWINKFPNDCHETSQLNIVYAPRIGQSCVYYSRETNQNISRPCGENQICHSVHSICICDEGFVQVPREGHQHCEPLDTAQYWTQKVNENSKLTTSGNYRMGEVENGEDNVEPFLKRAETRTLFKGVVIFLLIVTVILCITLGAVIIWSRRYRSLLHNLS